MAVNQSDFDEAFRVNLIMVDKTARERSPHICSKGIKKVNKGNSVLLSDASSALH